jgi:hypothetical protein
MEMNGQNHLIIEEVDANLTVDIECHLQKGRLMV